MRISDWSSDVCSSDLGLAAGSEAGLRGVLIYMAIYIAMNAGTFGIILTMQRQGRMVERIDDLTGLAKTHPRLAFAMLIFMFSMAGIPPLAGRSEEHTSELQSLMRISYAVFCLKKKRQKNTRKQNFHICMRIQ